MSSPQCQLCGQYMDSSHVMTCRGVRREAQIELVPQTAPQPVAELDRIRAHNRQGSYEYPPQAVSVRQVQEFWLGDQAVKVPDNVCWQVRQFYNTHRADEVEIAKQEVRTTSKFELWFERVKFVDGTRVTKDNFKQWKAQHVQDVIEMQPMTIEASEVSLVVRVTKAINQATQEFEDDQRLFAVMDTPVLFHGQWVPAGKIHLDYGLNDYADIVDDAMYSVPPDSAFYDPQAVGRHDTA